ncbi:MAG: hypothetical protein QM773_20810 [Hyphomonadaceae bacterium]
MSILTDNMQWVLLICGLLTLTMLQGVFAPRFTMRAYFGEAPDSLAADALMRSWSALVAFSGAFLIYAAYTPEVRPAATAVVGAGKLFFVVLLLSQPKRFFRGQAVTAIILDSLMVIIFAAFLYAMISTPA